MKLLSLMSLMCLLTELFADLSVHELSVNDFEKKKERKLYWREKKW